jgi:hypothetical protein
MGRPVVLDKKLVSKIAKLLKRDYLGVVKSVSGLASREHISSKVALILTATKYKIGSASFLKTLSQQEHMQLVGKLDESKPVVSMNDKKGKRIIKQGSAINSDFTDPYLPESVYANIPYEGYSIMFALENSIRFFISRVLTDNFGDNWWDQCKNKKSLEKTVENVFSRKTGEKETWFHSKRGAHEIFYTDYDDLLQILKTFYKVFSNFFKKGAEKNLINKLEELRPTRNVIAHNNPIAYKDLERLKVNARDWFSYMKYLASLIK